MNSLSDDSPGISLLWVDGRKCTDRMGLFNEFHRSLRFPSYFSHNWGSFDECISDMSWISGDHYGVCIKWPENLLQLGAVCDTLLSILQGAVLDREEMSALPTLNIVFLADTDHYALLKRYLRAQLDVDRLRFFCAT